MATARPQRSFPGKALLRGLKWLALGLAALVLILVTALAFTFSTQDGTIKLIQMAIYGVSRAGVNVDAPRSPPRDALRADGIRVKNDLRYGNRYPNSFLDIWYAPRHEDGIAPTVVFIHGGGWFAGAKNNGDPMAGGAAGLVSEPLAQRGFNVVSIDYALAPDYRYPVAMIQLNEALAYLRAHASELKLDMTNLILMGGSAGAQMTAQYGVLLSDPRYAAEVGIRPAMPRPDVKGLVIFSAPLRVSGFGWRMNRILWSYLGTKDLDNSPQARQLDLIPRINPDYPPTYLTDGNQDDTFPEHAMAMAQALQAKGVPHVFTYFGPEVAPLGHVYTGQLDTKYGRENFLRSVDFMKRQTQAGAATP